MVANARLILALSASLCVGEGFWISSAGAAITGQWNFEAGDLSATIGAPLAYRGTTSSRVLFGTTTSFGIPDIGGQPAKVMSFPACAPSEGFIMPTGGGANGGGINLNQYTLIMDVLIPSTSTGYGAFLQTDIGNTSDADLFVDPSNGIGVAGQFQGNLSPNVWHRVVFTVDLTKRELGKFIDGANVLTGSVGTSPGLNPMQYLDPTVGGVDGRWSLSTSALLFADDNLQTRAGYVNSIQLRDSVLSPAEILALGGATAAGIPSGSAAPSITTQPQSISTSQGATVVLQVVASGSPPLSYQWRMNGLPLLGANSTSLTFSPVQFAHAGSYDVVVANAAGSIISSPAFLTVTLGNTPPTVANPIADLGVSANAADTLIDLRTVFQDAETPNAYLAYAVQANSDPTLVTATVDDVSDQLTLHFLVNQTGTATITIRATDAGGLYVDATFGVTVSPVSFPTISGQWDFDNGDLSATVGSPLAYRGTTGSRVLFGTTTSFGIPDIGGQPAKLMTFPACAPAEGFFMPTGGGGTNNQYTLIMDLLIPSTSTGYGAFLQTDLGNTSDAELFVDPANGIGINGQFQGNLTPNVWHRLAFTVDVTRRELGKFIDGTNVLTGPVGTSPGLNPMQYLDPSGGGGPGGRWSLSATALLFADDDVQTRAGYVNSIQFRKGVLTPAQILALGGPTAAGIPLPTPTVANPVADISLPTDAPDTVIDLRSVFQDPETPASDLVYSVQNTDTTLLSATVDNASDTLTLHYQPGQIGQATITVRASNALGRFAEDSFVVTVNSPLAGLAVRKSGPGLITVEWNAPGFTLQMATNVTGPWSDLSVATSPYQTTIPTMKFFRLTNGGVYSTNAVSGIAVVLKPGYNLIQNPLDASKVGGNVVSNVLASVPDGTTVYRYTNGPAGQGFVINDYTTLFGWSDPTMSMAPGQGAIVFLPGATTFTNLFVGEVMQGTLTIPLAAGFNLVGSMVPQAGKITTGLAACRT